MSPLNLPANLHPSIPRRPSRFAACVAGVAVVAALAGPVITAPQSTLAEALDIGASVVVDTDRLNLRSDPAIAAEVLATFEDGTWGEVLDGPVSADGYEWYQYEVDGVSGWSVAEFLAPGEGERGLFKTGDAVFVNSDNVNLRSDAALDGALVTQVALGTKATVLRGPVAADGYFWYEVETGDVTGFMVRDYLAFVDPRTDRDESSDLGTSQAAGATGTVVDDLRLRGAAGLDATVIKVLPAGTVVTVVSGPVDADDMLWYEVDVDGIAGWVAGEFIDFSAVSDSADQPDSSDSPAAEPTESAEPEQPADADPAPEPTAESTPLAEGDAVKVTVDQLNLRATPTANGAVVSKLNRGATLIVLSGPVTADGMTWYEVESAAAKGWVVAEYIARIQP